MKDRKKYYRKYYEEHKGKNSFRRGSVNQERCKICGKIFFPKQRNVKYCSKKCNQKDLRRRNPTYFKSYYIKNQEIILARQKVANNERRRKCLVHYSENPPKCYCCGEMTLEFLTIDHINNDGAEHRRQLTKSKVRGGNIYGWIIKNNFPKIFKVLCYNCNCAKGFYGKCPHVIIKE